MVVVVTMTVAVLVAVVRISVGCVRLVVVVDTVVAVVGITVPSVPSSFSTVTIAGAIFCFAFPQPISSATLVPWFGLRGGGIPGHNLLHGLQIELHRLLAPRRHARWRLTPTCACTFALALTLHISIMSVCVYTICPLISKGPHAHPRGGGH